MLIENHYVFALVLIYISFSGVITAYIFRSKLSGFMKLMWVGFIWILPLMGGLLWAYIQSFEYKFKMDGTI